MNVVPDRGERRTLSNIDIAILAGGLGTRLSSVLPDAPKVMAPVGGRPFLAVLLRGLIGQGARRVLLCLGSKAQVVKDYLARHSFPPLEIRTVVEARPLGTAGALAFAAAALQSDPVMVLNGDTLIRADLEEFLASHKEAAASVSVLCVKVADARRYGRVEIGPGGRVTGFAEKNASMASAWVNAGAYLLDQSVLARIVAGGPGARVAFSTSARRRACGKQRPFLR
jgi:mannose-1-phosphate guanylyltransferase